MKNDNVRKVFYIKDMEKKEKKIPVSRSKSAFKERERERKEKERAEREKAKAVMEENLADENETQENETQETEKKPFSWKLAAGILAGVVITGAAGYVGMSMKYQNTYLPGTCINGMNAAGMSPKAVEEAMAKEAGDYSLRLVLRNDASENIEGSAIGLNTVFDGSLENILKQQNPYTWPIHMIKGENYEIETMLAYEDEALDQAVDSLNAMDPAHVTAPENAHLSDYIKGEGYSVIPETEGDQLNPEKVKEEVKAAINDLKEEIDLDELGHLTRNGERTAETEILFGEQDRDDWITFPYTVPEGCYFCLGDNRPRSEDSRELGAFRRREITGKVLAQFRLSSVK